MGIEPRTISKADALAEAYKRGLLPPDKKAAYEEAQRRGLVGGQPAAVAQPAAPQAASPAPVAKPAPDQMPWGEDGQAFARLHTPNPGDKLATTPWKPGEARGIAPTRGFEMAPASPQAMADKVTKPTAVVKPYDWEGPIPEPTGEGRSIQRESQDAIVQKWADYLYARRISETQLQSETDPVSPEGEFVKTRPFNIAGSDVEISGDVDKLWQQAKEAAERSGWSAPPRASQWNAAETVLNDLSLGFSDEIGGAIGAAGSYVANLPQGADAAAKAAGDTYTRHRDDANFTFNLARQDRPVEVMGGNVGTMLVPAVGATKAAGYLQGARTGNRIIDTSRSIGAQAATGAGLGALYGVGANHPGNPADLETTTLFGAAAGAGFATLAPVIGASFKKLDSLLDAKSKAFRSLPEPQQREIVESLAAQGLDADAIVNTIRTGRAPTAQAAAAQPSVSPVAQPTVTQGPAGGAQPGATGAGQQAAGAVPPAGPATLQASPTVVPSPQAASLARSDAKIIRRLLVAGGVARNDVDRLLGDMVEAFNRSNDPRSRLAFFAEEYLPQQLPKEVAEDVIQKLRGFGRERFGANSPRDPSRSIMRSNIGELRGSQREYLTDEFEGLLGKQSLMNKQGQITRDKQGVAEAVYREEIGRQQRLLADGLATPEQVAARDDLLLLMGREDFFKQVPAELHLKAADEGKSLWEFVHQNPLEAAHWMQSELGVLARKGNTIAQSMRMPLVRRLEDAVLGYRGARLDYGDLSGQQAALEFGDDLYRVAASKFDTDNKALEFKKLSPPQKTVAKKSIRDKLMNEFRKAKTGDDQAAVITAMQKDGVLDALETILGPDGKKVADAIRGMVRENERLRAVDLLSGSNTADNLAQQAAAREAVRSPINKSIGALGDEASYLQSGFADVVSVALGLPPVWTASKLGTKAVSKFGTPSKKKLASATRTLYGSPPRNALNVEAPNPPPGKPRPAPKPRAPKPPVTQEDLDALLAQYDKTPTPAIRNRIIAARKALGQAPTGNKLATPKPPPAKTGGKKPPPGTTSMASPAVTGALVGGGIGAAANPDDPGRGALYGAMAGGAVAGLGNRLSKMGGSKPGVAASAPARIKRIEDMVAVGDKGVVDVARSMPKADVLAAASRIAGQGVNGGVRITNLDEAIQIIDDAAEFRSFANDITRSDQGLAPYPELRTPMKSGAGEVVPFSKPKPAPGAGGAKRADDFDTSRVYYHGTTNQFDDFNGPTWLSTDRDYASDFSWATKDEIARGVAAPNVVEAYVRGSLKKVSNKEIEQLGYDEAAMRVYKGEGYDGVQSPDGQVLIFDPKNIRRKSAASPPGAGGKPQPVGAKAALDPDLPPPPKERFLVGSDGSRKSLGTAGEEKTVKFTAPSGKQFQIEFRRDGDAMGVDFREVGAKAGYKPTGTGSAGEANAVLGAVQDAIKADVSQFGRPRYTFVGETAQQSRIYQQMARTTEPPKGYRWEGPDSNGAVHLQRADLAPPSKGPGGKPPPGTKLSAFPGADEGSKLPMDEASRKARAEAQGFDTKYKLFHATHSDFDAFDTKKIRTDLQIGEDAIFLTNSPAVADSYLGGAFVQRDAPAIIEKGARGADMGDGVGRYYSKGAAVYPVYARNMKDYELWDMGGGGYDPVFMQRVIKEAKANGAPGVILRGVRDPGIMDNIGPQGNPRKPAALVVVFDPKDIRSVNASFDPAQEGSSKLLSAFPGGTAAQAASGAGGALYGAANPVDANEDGVIDDQDRAITATTLGLGGLTAAGLARNALSRGPRGVKPAPASNAFGGGKGPPKPPPARKPAGGNRLRIAPGVEVLPRDPNAPPPPKRNKGAYEMPTSKDFQEEALRKELRAARAENTRDRSRYAMRDNREELWAASEAREQRATEALADYLAEKAAKTQRGAGRRDRYYNAKDFVNTERGGVAIAAGLGAAGLAGTGAMLALSSMGGDEKKPKGPPVMSPSDPRFYWERVVTKNKTIMQDVQWALGEWGHWDKEVPRTGANGTNTKEGIRAWRESENLDPDKPMTRQELTRLLAGPGGYEGDGGKWGKKGTWYTSEGKAVRVPQ